MGYTIGFTLQIQSKLEPLHCDLITWSEKIIHMLYNSRVVQFNIYSTYLYQQYPAKASPAIPATLQPITITVGEKLEKIVPSSSSITWQKEPLTGN